VHLRLARAAVAAEHWSVAKGHLDKVRTSEEPPVRARADALAAQVAIGHRSRTVAEEFAGSALEAAQTIGLPDVACEALEVLGRCARVSDLERARGLFDRALQLATEHDLSLLRIRALHERGTIDALDINDTALLREAREQAVAAGAPALAAVLDIQMTGAVFAEGQPDQLRALAERAAATARLLDLRLVHSMALLWQAAAYAQDRNRKMMEELIDRALRDAEPDAEAMSFGWCRAVLALLEDDLEAALAALDTAERLIADQEAPNPWGFRGLWALMRTLAETDGSDARAQVRSSGAGVYWMNRAWLSVGDAVAAGREGDDRTAEECFRRGDETLESSPWARHLTRRLVAEAALSDGWGEPVPWLRSAADFFAETGNDRLRGACHSVLRRAGEPVPRRGRGESAVPAELKAFGVTSREVDVLRLVCERLGNREIAARLYLSPRTVEKHVASLVTKTGVPSRAELAAYADRLFSG
jgi:DNA-binding CsgD family transcriptional regulator